METELNQDWKITTQHFCWFKTCCFREQIFPRNYNSKTLLDFYITVWRISPAEPHYHPLLKHTTTYQCSFIRRPHTEVQRTNTADLHPPQRENNPTDNPESCVRESGDNQLWTRFECFTKGFGPCLHLFLKAKWAIFAPLVAPNKLKNKLNK